VRFVQCLTLEREQADLGSVAVGDDDGVVVGEAADRVKGGRDVGALGGGVGGLTVAPQRAAADGEDHKQDLIACLSSGAHQDQDLVSATGRSCPRDCLGGSEGLCAG
jgi:hypothetical protein